MDDGSRMDEVSPFEPTVVGSIAQHWRLVASVVAIVLVLGGLYAFTRPASYSATAALTVSDPRGPGVLNGQQPEDPQRYVSDQLVVFRSATLGQQAVVEGLAQKPPLKETPDWYLANTKASAIATDNNVISITFKAPTEAESLAGVNAVTSAYIAVVKASVKAEALADIQQVQASIDAINKSLAVVNPAPSASQVAQANATKGTLQARAATLAGEYGAPQSGVSQTLLPTHAVTAGKSAILRVMVLALAFGLLLGIALAYVRSYRKRVFVHQRDPEVVLGAPMLTDVSGLRTVDLVGLAPEAEAPRVEEMAHEMFGIAVSFLADQRGNDRGGLSLAVVGAHNGASCSAVSWRCALAFASQGLRVLLIDVDGSWPPARSWTTKVTDHLVWVERDDGSVALAKSRPRSIDGRSNGDHSAFSQARQSALYLCGEPPPVSSQRALRAVFRDLEDDFDIVLVNAPPFLPSADASYLTSAAGTALVVVPADGSVTDHEELARRLRLAAVTPIGYVYCCAGCEVESMQPGAAGRVRRALHVESKQEGAVLPKAAGNESARISSDRR
jgi:Mrp family chromosome partitioning ATPase/capsular polysaccharide biosynthesis protein